MPTVNVLFVVYVFSSSTVITWQFPLLIATGSDWLNLVKTHGDEPTDSIGTMGTGMGPLAEQTKLEGSFNLARD